MLEAGQIDEAIEQYKKCIETSPYLFGEEEFRGLGCIEDRIGYHYDSEFLWIEKNRQKDFRVVSPHDCLSVCLTNSKKYIEYREWY